MQCDFGTATLAPAGTSHLSSDLHETLWHQSRGPLLRSASSSRLGRIEWKRVTDRKSKTSPAYCRLYSTMGL